MDASVIDSSIMEYLAAPLVVDDCMVERPGNTQGAPGRNRQVNANARRPNPARARLGRTLVIILD